MYFAEFFRRATGGLDPYPYQARMAEAGLPDVLNVPMGSGKSSAVVLVWLWRLLYADADVSRGTPRRLVIALPLRSLIEQFETDARAVVERLGLADDIGVHVLMGGRRDDEYGWRIQPHRPSIVVGTVDMVLSKALNRGYGVSRSIYPIDFALVTNGAHVVIDEVQLARASTVTLRQIAGLRGRFGTAEPSGLTCMSATTDLRLIDTVDNPTSGSLTQVTLDDADHNSALGGLLAATKRIRQLTQTDDTGVAAHAVQQHRPGTRTLIVVNTVEAATSIYTAVLRQKPAADVLLLHSRFMPRDRASLTKRLTAEPGADGVIVVATQVAEAGVDVDAAVMITEAAPWPSICQRSGRCNRRGVVDEAEFWWFAASRKGPYEASEVAEAERVLTRLDGQACTGSELLAQPVAEGDLDVQVIRRPDFLALFDTAPDLSGVDLDIAPYIRETDDALDCQLAWIELQDGRAPGPTELLPPPLWRCTVALTRAVPWARSVPAWTFEPALGEWRRVGPGTRIRPGEVVLVQAAAGGYRRDRGFDPSSKVPVEVSEPAAEPVDTDVMSEDPTSILADSWQTLDDHLLETAAQASALLGAVVAELDDSAVRAVRAAALLHDLGKTHPDWQKALRSTTDEAAPMRLLAKSPGHSRLVVEGRPAFRHELLTALLLGDPASAALRADCDVRDEDLALTRYLAAAHHGKIRLQARQPSDSVAPRPGWLLGLNSGEAIPPVTVLGTEIDGWAVDLEPCALGGPVSWTATALDLLHTYGPFTLAYLEMLVRVADWRASAGMPRVGGVPE